MKKAKASLYISRDHVRKTDNTCPISVVIYYSGERRKYPTGISMHPKDFDDMITRIVKENRHPKKGDEAIGKAFSEAYQLLKQAQDIIEKRLNKVFSFGLFEQYFLSHYGTGESIFEGFTKYITELRDEGRVGTAVTYECAMKSLETFKKGLKFTDISAETLKKYERWMLAQNNSKATIGIYLRSLRTIFNQAEVDRAMYPFGKGRNKYTIPTGRNLKKALHLAEIAKIFSYKAPAGSTQEMARDYWIFMYLCNGMNLKDLCQLKRKNVNGDLLTYDRAKTINSNKDSKSILVSLKPEAKAIILKWGQVSLDPESFVFPHLTKGINPESERKIIQLLNQIINKYMKRIGEKLGIKKPLTTYAARHSFATVMKRAGTSTEMISELLRHSSVQMTQNYLDNFENEQIHEATNALTNFAKSKP